MFEGPVARTEKNRATGPDATDGNRTTGCGCSIWAPVAVHQQTLENPVGAIAVIDICRCHRDYIHIW